MNVVVVLVLMSAVATSDSRGGVLDHDIHPPSLLAVLPYLQAKQQYFTMAASVATSFSRKIHPTKTAFLVCDIVSGLPRPAS